MSESEMKIDLDFVKNKDVETVVEKLLFVLGFQSRLIGTNFLAEAIALKYADDGLLYLQIYAQIAEKHSTTSGNVERAIRHTLSNCRNEGEISDFNKILGCNVIDRKVETTSGEFISIVCKWLHWVRSNDK
ncbi:MAG: sporulation initiation factor Spo0A C-terminal domain-containing protein [Corallococcus sp.]|nr:sporulation initiation factor Spo0A C-terminal domain-containing protein [Corallococcus sp.]MCM1359993.1 sporulation initiation factor Spo0A C-terminal domain-containing protein [Corallococcus sp.]MCM1395550.1 sporulation initiation factor Spo0A C-terminal domain-containing protein [Corallococcus sp.]